MSIRPRTLAPVVVVALLLVGLTGCSNGAASVSGTSKEPSPGDTASDETDGAGETDQPDGTDATDEPEADCAATAVVGEATYHVVRAMSTDYAVNPTYQVEGSATDCAGDGPQAMTFHAIPHVDPAWALCGLVDGRWRVFLADDMAVPANSTLARIVVGE